MNEPEIRIRDYTKALARYNIILKEVGAEGFPPDPMYAFIEATELNNNQKKYKNRIIMSRVPGGASTKLIAEGYDTKGFFIKSKSCDWGPMAGFVCKLPPLNKAGFDKIKYNYKNTKYFWDLCQKKGKSKIPFKSKTYPFRQIKISKKRFESLQNSFDDQSNTTESFFNIQNLIKVGDKNMYWGIASNKNKNIISSVKIEFLLIWNTKDEVYDVFHGKISTRKDPTKVIGSEWGDYEDYFNMTNKPNYLKQKEIYEYNTKSTITLEKDMTEDVKKKLLRVDFQLFQNFPTKTFYQLEGICNLDSLLKIPDNKSTVTGDYDLFVIWPVFNMIYRDIKNSLETKNELRRLSEENYCKKIAKQNNSIEIINEAFTSYIDVIEKLQVVIQFIPHFDEIGELESSELGNYNDTGLNVVNDINNKINTSNKNLKYKIAHHSDEGGRPEINLLDLPVLAFFPTDFMECDKNFPTPNEHQITGMYLIKTPGDFFRLCKGLQDKYTRDIESVKSRKITNFTHSPLVLNHAWLLNLIACVKTDVELRDLMNNDEKLNFIKKDKEDKEKGLEGKGEIFDDYDKFCKDVEKQRIQDQNNTPPTLFDLDNLRDVFFPFLNDSGKEDFFNKLLVILIAYTFNKSKSAIDVKKEFDDLYFDSTGIRL